MITLDQRAACLLSRLGRGGRNGYFWTVDGEEKRTRWYLTKSIPRSVDDSGHFYFGVNPTATIPSRGDPDHIRAYAAEICAVNCLFAEFDAKDFSGGKAEAFDHIQALFVPPSVIIDSGGGYHGYWLLAEPFILATDQDRAQAGQLQARWVEFTGGDPAAKDLARVLRVPGSWNRKYDPARPVEFVKANWECLYTLEQLEQCLPMALEPARMAQEPHYTAAAIDDPHNSAERMLQSFLDKTRAGRRSKNGYLLARQLQSLGLTMAESEPFMVRYAAGVPAGDHPYTEKDAISNLKSAFKSPPMEPPMLKNPPVITATAIKLPEKIAGPKEITVIPEPPEEPPVDETTTETPEPARPARKTSWTMSEIYETEFPDPNWIIPGIIQEGLVLLAGRPKVGKSWMLLQIAFGVAVGGRLFDREIQQGNVLYLALEDTPRRIKNRCQKMGVPKNAPIRFEFSWKPLQGGGLNDLYAAVESGKYRLIVIDTLARVIPGVNQNDENPIGPIMDQLQNMAINHGMTILPGDHTRKSNGVYADPIDDVMGNTAKSRAIDAVLAIYKEQGKAGASLRGRGRETEEIDLALTFDPVTGCWQSNGDSGEFRLTVRRKEIIDAVRTLGKCKLKQVMDFLGEKPQNKGNLYSDLAELINTGRVFSETIGRDVYYYVQK